MESFKKFTHVGLALDPIHVGTGGTRIGRVDLTIVRDPVTRVPKVPGSSLAGVYRTYVAMHFEEKRWQQQSQKNSGSVEKERDKLPYYPDCAGLGLDEKNGHCRRPDCPVCTVFGFARGANQRGGFAGLAAFTDAHVLLFPVPTRKGPMWVTSPLTLKEIVPEEVTGVDGGVAYLAEKTDNFLNLGWLLLKTDQYSEMEKITECLKGFGVPKYIRSRLIIVPDSLFSHIVNSNLEVRTSVSINPATGAAEEGALFSYEALPRGTVLVWEVIAKNPKHFQIEGKEIAAVSSPDDVHEVVEEAHPYFEHLGIGGMGTRGMGRVKVLYADSHDSQRNETTDCSANTPSTSSEEAPNEGGEHGLCSGRQKS